MSNNRHALFDKKGRLNFALAEQCLLNQGKYLYEAFTETYFAFNGRFYSPIHEIAFEKKISELFGSSIRESDIRVLLKRFTRRIGVHHLLIEHTNKNLLNLQNGVLDLSDPSNTSLLPHSSDIVSFSCVSTKYDSSAQCPEWMKFLNTVTQGDRDTKRLIQEMFGYCLLPGNWMQVAFILMGDGNNGKSTLLEVLRALLGDASTSSLSLNELDQRFKRALLRGKLANISDEAPTGKEISSDVFKNLVGGGIITAEEKNKPPFQFQNTAKIITAANKPPVLREQTHALHRRLVVIPFEHQITKDERNPYMIDLLKNEMSGILNWAIRGLRRLQKQKMFTDCPAAEAAKGKFIKDSDSVMLFVEECCKRKSSFQVSTIGFYRAYRKFCDERGYLPCADNEFGKRLKLHIKTLNRQRLARDGNREWIYQGVKLTDEAESRYDDAWRSGARH